MTCVPRRSLAPVLCALALGGCGGDGPDKPAERADRPAQPPPGWRTVRNPRAGFTVAAPRPWTARTRRGATLIRSRDRLVAATFVADRGPEGRGTAPARYAEETLTGLPGFEGSVLPGTRHVRGTPYRTARVEGVGSIDTTRRPQRITVAAYQRPALVTYAAVVFRNARALSAADESVITRMLRTLRGQPPPS